ncbi:M48 family metalloprotease [Nocardiopsis sp. HNM0947]|uniref:M48 family metalloprotease n=1 Tax=Nocardiopsis coralli TaxID=2772213 RepID=A0ABR9PE47_9ACTN|nr:M48 family metalloprotease [Nocardiopsis coralli]MBE3002122.1 M48 family metalloprotease [Nocardiopsis coralli]
MYCDQCGSRLSQASSRCPNCDSAPPLPPSAHFRSRPGGDGADDARGKKPEPRFDPAAPPTQRSRRWGPSLLLENPWANLAALATAWLNLPLVVLFSAIGAIFGAVAGLFSGGLAGPGVLSRLDLVLDLFVPLPVDVEELLPTASVLIGGTIGAIIGAVNGALNLAYTGLVAPWTLLWQLNPVWPIALLAGQVVCALALAIGYVFYTRYTERSALYLAGARRPSRREAELFLPMVATISARMGLRSPPPLLIDDSRAPKAYAAIQHIVITRGMLEVLGYERSMVSGVLAHEIAHIKHGDAVAGTWTKAIALPAFLVFEIAYRLRARSGLFFALFALFAWSVLVCVRLVVMPLNASRSRRAEERADREAARAGYGTGLYNALATLGTGFDGARTGWDRTVLASHPPFELRLEALEEPGGLYPLPNSHAASVRRDPDTRLYKD